MSEERKRSDIKQSHWDLMSCETGKEALMLGDDFNERVLIIKHHIHQDDHPMNIIREEFCRYFVHHYQL
eukprot:CAMPEP_0170565700 /NCGR_PEP_ID=MMETSP0211-20121228/79360_1 /TAXON_ID=311385 /ORGANISM="Pseudokeronopsis sp., Strain OXSARD2" /LENGTH=68 /DNA_ID=CAMNT_0010886653 /DNA_START=129 /DNA_END=335 /DNA_ORIENTATION=-